MSDGIVIIGSGFAARQLVKNIRKQDTHIPLTLIAADSMDEYNKPDLSHVVSRGQRADDLTLQTAGEFAEQYHLRLFPYTWVSGLDAAAKVVKSQDREWRYDKLVLATGAGSLILSHVNDAGFWLVKQYFNMTVAETFKTWSMMETILSVVGIIFIMLLAQVV